MPKETGGILNLKKPVGSDDIRLQTIGIDLPYNFQKIDDAFTAHQAESAQKHITESGENANGRYVRFDDGTQICFRTANISFNTTSAQLFEYPATFTKVIGGGWSVEVVLDVHIHRMLSKEFPGVELSSSGWIIWFRYSTQLVDATRFFYLFAIGRWK